MGLLPREATYAEEVADFFLAFRGSGLALSPLDAELVLEWQAREVPYPVVCRGIRRAAEQRRRDLRPEEPALRTLRSCRRAVDDEFKRFLGLAAGRSAKPAASSPGIDRLGKARAALRRAARQGSPAVNRAVECVRARAAVEPKDPVEAAALVASLDDALALSYLRALAFPLRLELLRRVRERVGAALARMSPRARRAALRAHRVIEARAHGGLPQLR